MKTTLLILIISFISLKAEDTLSVKDESYNDWKFGMQLYHSSEAYYTSTQFENVFNLGAGLYTEKHLDSIFNRNLSVIFALQYLNKRVSLENTEKDPYSDLMRTETYKEKNHYLALPIYFSYDIFRHKEGLDVVTLLLGGYGAYLLESSSDAVFEETIYRIDNYNRFEYGISIGLQYYISGDKIKIFSLTHLSLANKIKEGDEFKNFSSLFGISFGL